MSERAPVESYAVGRFYFRYRYADFPVFEPASLS